MTNGHQPKDITLRWEELLSGVKRAAEFNASCGQTKDVLQSTLPSAYDLRVMLINSLTDRQMRRRMVDVNPQTINDLMKAMNRLHEGYYRDQFRGEFHTSARGRSTIRLEDSSDDEVGDRPGRTSRGTRKCGYCGRGGHRMRYCFDNPDSTRYRGGRQQKRDRKWCERCKVNSHNTVDCWARERQRNSPFHEVSQYRSNDVRYRGNDRGNDGRGARGRGNRDTREQRGGNRGNRDDKQETKEVDTGGQGRYFAALNFGTVKGESMSGCRYAKSFFVLNTLRHGSFHAVADIGSNVSGMDVRFAHCTFGDLVTQLTQPVRVAVAGGYVEVHEQVTLPVQNLMEGRELLELKFYLFLACPDKIVVGDADLRKLGFTWALPPYTDPPKVVHVEAKWLPTEMLEQERTIVCTLLGGVMGMEDEVDESKDDQVSALSESMLSEYPLHKILEGGLFQYEQHKFPPLFVR